MRSRTLEGTDVSVLSEALGAIREALKLADDLKRTEETITEVARKLREQDRRSTRLEAQWDTAMRLGAQALRPVA